MADKRAKSGFLSKFLWGLAFVAVAAGLWLALAPPSPDTWENISGILDWEADTPAPPIADNEDKKPDPAAEAVAWPTFDVVRVSRGGTGVIAGRAAPFANVEVLANGKTLGRVTADMRGEWVLIFDEPLKSGGSELSLVSTLPGQDPVASKDIVVVVVPEKDETFADPADEGVLAIMTRRDGSGRSVLLQRPAGVDFGGGLALDTVDYNEAGAAIFSGRAAPKSELRLYVDNAFKGVARSNEGGRWSYAMAEPLASGEHVVRLDQVVGDGKVQLRVEMPFNRDEPLDTSRAAGSIVVQPGNNLWQISRKLYGTGFHYTVIFRLNRDNIKDPDLIYPDQVFALPKEKPNNP